MPYKTRQEHYQGGRKHKRLSVTLSPQAMEDIEAILRAKPDLVYVSTAIAWAVGVAREKIPEKK